MDTISVVSIARARHIQIKRLIAGLSNSILIPDEYIIVYINEEPDQAQYTAPFKVKQVTLTTDTISPLPLAKARNLAAQHASGDYLVFLDADCIPTPNLVQIYADSLFVFNGIIMGQVLYLPEVDLTGWTYAQLNENAKPYPPHDGIFGEGLRETDRYDLFRSLTFGIRRRTFTQLNGFDDRFTGYGADDLDFAFRARRQDIPFATLGPAKAYHQYHTVKEPPLHHFKFIIENAARFFEKWQTWPMTHWLTQFRDRGYIDWNPTSTAIIILKHPSPEEVHAIRPGSPL